MALELTVKSNLLLQQRNIEPNLILEIDGIPTLYTAIDTFKIARYGEDGILYGDPLLLYGGGVKIADQETLISLDGSSSSLQWQLLQDKGGSSSVASMSIDLIDQDGKISKLVSPGFVLNDLLSAKCKVYISFNGANHPEDSVLVHKGTIKQITTKPASCELVIAHPEQQKRQELFIKQTSKLVSSINNSVTAIDVVSTAGFILPTAGHIESYITLNDEIIQYTGIAGNQLTGCTRGALGTLAAAHAAGDEADTFYKLSGDAIDLALKIMISKSAEYFATEDIIHIGKADPSLIDDNIIFFKHPDIQSRNGLVIGDLVRITGSLIVGNNTTGDIITGFGKNNIGSWVSLALSYAQELNSPASIEFKSKYNVLTEGMGITPDDIDVERHETLKTRFSSTVASYEFYIKDTIKGKEFLTEQIYYPSGFYSLPRKSRASVGITVPPIATDQAVVLDEISIVKASELKPTRSIDKNFFNAYIIKYDELPNVDKFTSAKVFFSADSQNRILNVGNKPKTIESQGLRTSGATDVLIRINARRFLERYQFASESISNIKVLFKDGFRIDIGDVVIFGSPGLKVTDLVQGSRNFQPKLYEVINKKLDLKTGDITVDILSTSFNLDGRYGVIAPSSKIISGNTTSVIVQDSFSTRSPSIEKTKWNDYIGELVYVHNYSYTLGQEIVLLGFDPQNDYKMLFDGALSFTPDSTFVVDIAYYGDDLSNVVKSKLKLLHCFMGPQLTVLNPISPVVFDVSDISKVFVGSILRIHTYDYSVDSIEVVVSNITGNTVTVSTPLGFTPLIGYFIDLVGFKDQGLPYRYI